MSLLKINPRPSPAQLRVFAAGWLAFAGVLGFLQWRHDRPVLAGLAWGLGLAFGLTGLIWPAGLRWLYLGLSYVTYPVGFVVSTVVLAAFYYAGLTPLGLILRLVRHDPLKRRFDPTASTYWQNRPSSREPESYFRQY